jgi:hypothetical protein
MSTPICAPKRIGGYVAQRGRGCLEQGVVEHGRVRQGQLSHLLGQREDHVMIVNGQQQLGFALQPTGAG